MVDDRELITVPTETRFHLEKTSSYTKGISIIGFVFAFILVLASLGFMVGGSSMASMVPGMALLGAGVFTFLGLFLLVFTVIFIFLMVKLLRFGSQTTSGIMNEDNQSLELGLKDLKTYFMGCGILAIVSIVFVILAVIAFGGMLMAGLSGL